MRRSGEGEKRRAIQPSSPATVFLLCSQRVVYVYQVALACASCWRSLISRRVAGWRCGTDRPHTADWCCWTNPPRADCWCYVSAVWSVSAGVACAAAFACGAFLAPYSSRSSRGRCSRRSRDRLRTERTLGSTGGLVWGSLSCISYKRLWQIRAHVTPVSLLDALVADLFEG